MPDFIAVDEINSQVTTSESNIINKISNTSNTIKNDTDILLNINNKLITQSNVTYETNVTNKNYLVSQPEAVSNSFNKTFVSTGTTFVVNTKFVHPSNKEYVYVRITDTQNNNILAQQTNYYTKATYYSSLVVSNAVVGRTYKVSVLGDVSYVNSCTVENLDSNLYSYNKYLANSTITSSNYSDIKEIGSFHSEGYGTLNLIYSIGSQRYTSLIVNKNGVSNIIENSTNSPYIEGIDSSTYLIKIPVEYNDDLVFSFRSTRTSDSAHISNVRLSTSIVNAQGANIVKKIQRGVAYANTGNLGTYTIQIGVCNPQKSLCLLNSNLPLRQLNYTNLIVGDTANQQGTVSYQIIEFY